MSAADDLRARIASALEHHRGVAQDRHDEAVAKLAREHTAAMSALDARVASLDTADGLIREASRAGLGVECVAALLPPLPVGVTISTPWRGEFRVSADVHDSLGRFFQRYRFEGDTPHDAVRQMIARFGRMRAAGAVRLRDELTAWLAACGETP